MEKKDYSPYIQELIGMLESKDADKIDRHLFRYEDKGIGMLFIALYHALKESKESKESNGSKEKEDIILNNEVDQ